MEKETLTIVIEAKCFTSFNNLQDQRTIKVQASRGDVAKKLDEICADIEASFES